MADFLKPVEVAEERHCHSSPSSPSLKRRLSMRCRRSSSSRTRDTRRESERETLTPPNSPRSIARSLRNKLRPKKQQTSPPALPPSITVSTTDDKENETNEGETPVITKEGTNIQQSLENLSLRGLRNDPSKTSMDSGYTSDNHKQSKVSLDSRDSSSDLLDRSFSRMKRPSVSSSLSQSSTSLQPQTAFTTQSNSTSCSSIPLEVRGNEVSAEMKPGDERTHPNHLFSVGNSDSNLCHIPEREPLDLQPNSPTHDQPSPTDSTTSSTSSTSSCSSSSRRRSSLSHTLSLTPPRNSISHSPPTRGSLPRGAPFRGRCSTASATVAKFYKVTPRKYLKGRRSTSAMLVSELMSDDEDSVNGRLRKLTISISNNTTQQSGAECPKTPSEEVSTAPWCPTATETKTKVHLSKSLPPQLEPTLPCSSSQSMEQWMRSAVQQVSRQYEVQLERVSSKCEDVIRRECGEVKNQVRQLRCEMRCTQSSVKIVGSTESFVNIVLKPDCGDERGTCCGREGGERRHSDNMSCSSPSHSQRDGQRALKDPCELPQGRVSTAVLRDLSQELVYWKFPARALGMTDTVIDRIERENHMCIREQCYKILLLWLEEKSESASYDVLGRALMKEARGVYPRYVDIVYRHCSS